MKTLNNYSIKEVFKLPSVKLQTTWWKVKYFVYRVVKELEG